MQKNHQGQIGLILLLVMGVVIAVALSLASRSLSDTVLSRQELESSTAFRLAESGVEAAMNQLRQDPSQTVAGNGSAGIYTSDYAVQKLNSYGLYVKEGENAYLDLTGFNANNNLSITWSKKNDNSENLTCQGEGSGNAPAAVEVMSHQAGSDTVKFSYHNAFGCDITANGFAGSSGGGSDYVSTVSYDVPNGTTSLRIRPLYAPATVTVAGSGLTTQLYLIQAQAEGGDAKKEIEVKRGLDAPPSIFDFALFSGSTIVK